MNGTDLAHPAQGGGLSPSTYWVIQLPKIPPAYPPATNSHDFTKTASSLKLSSHLHLLKHLQHMGCGGVRWSMVHQVHGAEGPPRTPQPESPHKRAGISPSIPKTDTCIKQTSSHGKAIGARLCPPPPPISVHTVS